MAYDLGAFDEGSETTAPQAPQKDLTWRLDPNESYSDWTVVVSSGDDDEQTKYHIHKCIVGVGARRSLFLAGKFDATDDERETQTTCTSTTPIVKNRSSIRSSTIRLEQPVAALFPKFLDFLYSQDKETLTTTDEAVALRYLSTLMGVKELHDFVTDFIQNDLTSETAFTYLGEASKYNDEKVKAVAMDLCQKTLASMDPMELSEYLQVESRPNKRMRRVLFRSSFHSLPTPVKIELLQAALCSSKTEKIEELELLRAKVKAYESMSIFGVWVENAGIAELNGMYRHDGTFHGMMKFSKDGIWNHKAERFCLYRWDSDKSIRWYIAFLEKGRDPDNQVEIDFYRSSHAEESEPPLRGWEKNGEGVDPPPVCRIVRI